MHERFEKDLEEISDTQANVKKNDDQVWRYCGHSCKRRRGIILPLKSHMCDSYANIPKETLQRCIIPQHSHLKFCSGDPLAVAITETSNFQLQPDIPAIYACDRVVFRAVRCGNSYKPEPTPIEIGVLSVPHVVLASCFGPRRILLILPNIKNNLNRKILNRTGHMIHIQHRLQ